MSSKPSKWIKDYANLIGTFILIVIAGFKMTASVADTRATILAGLKQKVDIPQALLLIDDQLKKQAFPLKDGEVLKTEYLNLRKGQNEIKTSLSAIEGHLLTISQNIKEKNRTRTMANKINSTIPPIVINPLGEPSGDENIKIKDLNKFRLTK